MNAEFAAAFADAIIKAPPEVVSKALREVTLGFIGLGDDAGQLPRRYTEAAAAIKATLDAALGPDA